MKVTWNADRNCRETKLTYHVIPRLSFFLMFHLYLEAVSSLSIKNMSSSGSIVFCQGIMDELEKLKTSFAKKPHSSLAAEATYLCDTIKPQMVALRAAVDKAESVMEASIYPYPTYEQMIYSHHF